MKTVWAQTSLSLTMADCLCVLCRSYKCEFRGLRYCLCFDQSRRSKTFMKINLFKICGTCETVLRKTTFTGVSVESWIWNFQATSKLRGKKNCVTVCWKKYQVITLLKHSGKCQRLGDKNRVDSSKCESEFATLWNSWFQLVMVWNIMRWVVS